MASLSSKIAAFPFERVRPFALRTVIGSVIAAALVGVAAVVAGDFGDTAWRALGTIFLFVFFSVLTWVDAGVSVRRAPWFAALSFLTSFYLFLAGILKIWLPADTGMFSAAESTLSWLGLLVVARVGLLHVHVVANTKRRLRTRLMDFVSDVTLGLVALLAVMLSLPRLLNGTEFPDVYWRAVGAVAILDALGTVLIPLSFALFSSDGGATAGTKVTPASAWVRDAPAAEVKPVFPPPAQDRT